MPPATVAELAVYLHCSERSAWGHLIALRKRGLINWTTAHGVIQNSAQYDLTESPVSLQTFAVSNDHVVVDPDQDRSFSDPTNNNHPISPYCKTLQALQTLQCLMIMLLLIQITLDRSNNNNNNHPISPYCKTLQHCKPLQCLMIMLLLIQIILIDPTTTTIIRSVLTAKLCSKRRT